MINSYSDFVKSLVLDIKKGNEVSFLLGSAVSCSPDGKGVPSVSGMNEILREYMRSLDIYDELESDWVKLKLSETEKYQRGFEYLLKVGDQNDVKEIMLRAMSNVRENDEWLINKTLKDFSNLIFETEINVKCILTTNFDPLIEEALLKAGRDCNVHNLIIDQPIGSVKSYSGGSIPVVHLHGVWDGDTMHTQTQLTVLRKKIETSIKNILGISKLYVIGYAGWDDVFLQALKDVVHDFQPSYNIRWAFFNHSASEIQQENSKLIEIVQPALTNARFQGYAGVDCNKFFEDVAGEISKKKEVGKFRLAKGGLISKKDDNTYTIITYQLSVEPAHDIIRLVEQEKAEEYLNSHNSFELIAGWGYGKSGFLYSFLHDQFDDHVYFYTDLSGLSHTDEFTKKIKQDIGIDITMFISSSEIGKRILIIDNIPRLEPQVIPFFSELASLALDYTTEVKIIFISNIYHGFCKDSINLNPLSVDDIKEYTKVGSDIGEIKREDLDRLYEVTNGIPIKLDKLKEYNNLMSFKDVLDAGQIMLTEGNSSTEIPHHLAKTIKEIRSDEPNLYKLLCVFSVLDCGERLVNIKSHYSQYNFQFEDFAKLERLGLIYKITKENDKILRISPVVNDFIKHEMGLEVKSTLIKKSLELCLGSSWMAGDVDISSVLKMMLKNTEFYPGNAHTAISAYFSLLDVNLLDREVKALIHVSVGYCIYLHDACYYKELVAFSRMIYSKISHLDINDKFRIAHYLSSGLRMIDEHQQCIDFIKPLQEEYLEKSYCEKKYYYNMLENIMMASSSLRNGETEKFANILKKNTPKSSVYLMNAESYLAETLPKEMKIKKLISIEKKARSYGYNILANNISIRLQNLLPSTSFEYIKKVIDDNVTVYTKARALIIKYEELLRRGDIDKIHSAELRELTIINDYLFSQRLDTLFNRCTDVIWKVMKEIGDISGLYYIFKRGSVIWRVTSLYEKELYYAQDLNNQKITQVILLDDAKYLSIRLSFLIFNVEKND
ncbi:SIR2 family protein [Pectobacterium brasiliense]|uniref:SIR2 family protein n=1 Tax=Pectobacterium brasiliense TaxID=180957 RepID=UPI002A828A60|nr:SIR2 family protein [Pectobacterium brasiliense]MDY4323703.1 SIR2 family protein [Pectobacterium brasiliense]